MENKDVLLNEVISIIRKLSDVSDSLVIVGGVATFLYDFHDMANADVKVKTTYTTDLDFGIKHAEKIKGANIQDRVAEIGFTPADSFLMDSGTPLTKFVKDVKGESVEIEFLVPLTGPETTRDGKPRILKPVSSHINAQMLRFLDLLLHTPDRLSLSRLTKKKEDDLIFFQIPQPAHYLIHKYITLHRRSKIEAKQKDAFYIYEFLIRFEKSWMTLINQIQELIESREFKSRPIQDFVASFRSFFASADAEGVQLIMEEHKRSYSGKYKLSPPQVFDLVDRFTSLFNPETKA